MNSQLQPEFCNTCFPKLLVQVPKGHCWVEGDNAEVSLDSKSFGPVSCHLYSFRAFFLFCMQVVHLRSPHENWINSDILRAHALHMFAITFLYCDSIQVSFSEAFGASFSCCSLRYFWFGMQIPLALLKGRVTNVIWPPSRFGRVESHLPEGRVLSQNRGMRP
jgi:hypothetical protein